MDIFWSAVGGGVLLLFFLSMGTWIFASMLAVSIVSLWLFGDFGADRIGLIFSRILYRASNSWELSAIPLFILMGELIFRSNISERVSKGWCRSPAICRAVFSTPTCLAVRCLRR
jgi:TRAP-type mannitol/chloroaromatic compound transport system permease large subunit